jgi:hypothetical protein
MDGEAIETGRPLMSARLTPTERMARNRKTDAGAATHIADVLSDAVTVADRTRAEVGFCIPGSGAAGHARATVGVLR